jgi:transcriptional regulator with XRE-family HTH domain
VFTTAKVLRGVRGAAGLSVRAMARLTHFSPSYLSMVEGGKRPASPEIVAAYERVLGVGGLGEVVDRRRFLTVTALVAVRASLVSNLAASIAGGDVGPLTAVQTTHEVDLSVAAVADRPMASKLIQWMLDGETAVVRVNAAGILAKIPGQADADAVARSLRQDEEIRALYTTAVVARVCGLGWETAKRLSVAPQDFPNQRLVAERFAREAINPRDAGARWCSAVMLQRLSPMIGRYSP